MKILSIDTASDICGVSILEDSNLICKLDCNTGRTHSENLMPMIKDSFSKTNLSLDNIDLIVCDKGPGSFTGIRIGISTSMAFSDSLSINCIGISSLESLAYNIKDNGLICSLIDCKNDNCYFALYELKNGIYSEVLSPNSDNISNILKTLNIYDQNITFVGSGAIIYSDFIKNYHSTSTYNNLYIFADSRFCVLDSFSLGLAGFHKFTNGIFSDVLPLYLKKPQAQRQLEEKLKMTKS